MGNSNIDIDAIFSKIAELASTYGIKLVLTLIVLIVGF